MPSPNAIFTELVTATDRNWGETVADNLSAHNALIRTMKDKGKIKTFSGGYELVERLEYGQNNTYQRFTGYDQLNTQASDVLTSAAYPMRNIQISVTASGQELAMNSGKERMIDLVKAKKANAIKSAMNQFSVDLYSTGALAQQINGLGNLIQTNGQGTVGGINSGVAANAFWRNQFREMTGTNTAATPTVANSASMMADMNRLWLATVRGNDMPDLIIMSHDLYALYEIGQQDKQRYTDPKTAKAGFSGLTYKGVEVIFDDNANFGTTAELCYFLNTDYLYLKQHRDASWTADEVKRPANQDATIVPIYWRGNLVCSNRARQGVLFDAA